MVARNQIRSGVAALVALLGGGCETPGSGGDDIVDPKENAAVAARLALDPFGRTPGSIPVASGPDIDRAPGFRLAPDENDERFTLGPDAAWTATVAFGGSVSIPFVIESNVPRREDDVDVGLWLEIMGASEHSAAVLPQRGRASLGFWKIEREETSTGSVYEGELFVESFDEVGLGVIELEIAGSESILRELQSDGAITTQTYVAAPERLRLEVVAPSDGPVGVPRRYRFDPEASCGVGADDPLRGFALSVDFGRCFFVDRRGARVDCQRCTLDGVDECGSAICAEPPR